MRKGARERAHSLRHNVCHFHRRDWSAAPHSSIASLSPRVPRLCPEWLLKATRRLRRVWEVLYGAAVELIADNGLVFASSIAFFTIFSLAPLLLLVVAVTGMVFGEDHTRAEIQSQFESLMGSDSGQFIAGVISRASKVGGGVGAVIIIGPLLFGATGVL